MKRIFSFLVLVSLALAGSAQGLLDELGDDEDDKVPVRGTFETTRIVNLQSVVNPAPKELVFLISHRFGELSSGLTDLFGLDQSNIRFGFDYGITHRLAVGIGRTSNPKTLDGFVKYQILEQTTGKKPMPLTLTVVGEAAMNIGPWADPLRDNLFRHRMAYTFQVSAARKFNKHLSLQLSPTVVHKNIVPLADDANDLFVMAAGGRYKVTRHMAINMEYGYILPVGNVPQYASRDVKNSLSIGIDLETGGHVFQVFATNSLACFNRGVWAETTDSWLDGGIHLGFNITRSFMLGKDKRFN